MDQVFVISVSSDDGGLQSSAMQQGLAFRPLEHLTQGPFSNLRITDDSSGSEKFTSHFELGFEEHDEVRPRGEGAKDRREHQSN